MSHFPSLRNATLLDAFQRWPEHADAFHVYVQQVMRGESPLREGLRELLGAWVSKTNGCNFCTAAHAGVAERFGEDTSALDDLDGSSLEESEKALFRYAEKLTREPAAMTAEDVDRVLAAGWDENALYHAIHVCMAFNAVNRLVLALGTEGDERIADMAARMVHERGYPQVEEMTS